MILEHYLQKRNEEELDHDLKFSIVDAVVTYNRLDAIDWIIQLGDSHLLKLICTYAACFGRIDILTYVFCKCNLTMLDKLLDDDTDLCYDAACYGHLETLKWLQNHGAKWNANTFNAARDRGYDRIVQYLRALDEDDDY